jgi:hypothetical protein
VAAIVHSVEISRSLEDVFACLSDFSRFAEWQEGLVSTRLEGDGPVKVGSRVTQTRRVGGGERTMTSEVTEYSPPRSYAASTGRSGRSARARSSRSTMARARV